MSSWRYFSTKSVTFEAPYVIFKNPDTSSEDNNLMPLS